MSTILRASAPQQRGRCPPANVVAPCSRIVSPVPRLQRDKLLAALAPRQCRARCVAEENQVSEASIFVDAGTDITDTAKYMEGMPAEAVAGAYAFYDEHRTLQFVGISQNLRYQFEEHLKVVPQQLRAYVRVRAIRDVAQATEEKMVEQARVKRSVLQARAWIDEAGGELPPGNSDEAELWGPSQPPPDSDEAAEVAGGTADGRVKISPFSQATVHRQVGESAGAAAGEKEMTVETVDKALNDIRQYLFADGGDIRVLRVEAGKVFVQFEGACASCSSQETTMTMGVQRALKAAFGSQLEEVVPVEEEGGMSPSGEGRDMTVAEVDSLLALLRPAVASYGGKMEVVGIEGGVCTVRYKGPDAIWTGVKMAIHDKFGDEVNDVIRVEVEEVSAGGASVEVPSVE